MIHLPIATGKSAILSLGSIVLALGLVAVDPSPYTPWILGALVPIGLVISVQLLYAQRTRSKERDQLLGRLAVLETQVSPFWASLQKVVGEALHHPHPESFEKDRLIEKLENLTISPYERARLEQLLHEIVRGDHTPDEKAKADILLKAMPLVIIEREKGLAKE